MARSSTSSASKSKKRKLRKQKKAERARADEERAFRMILEAPHLLTSADASDFIHVIQKSSSGSDDLEILRTNQGLGDRDHPPPPDVVHTHKSPSKKKTKKHIQQHEMGSHDLPTSPSKRKASSSVDSCIPNRSAKSSPKRRHVASSP